MPFIEIQGFLAVVKSNESDTQQGYVAVTIYLSAFV